MCTDFLIQAVDGTYVNGRTMEFAQDLKTQIHVRAPKVAGVLNGLDEEKMELTPTYGFVGTSAFNTSICTDGLNTAGLSTGALWLPGTQYQSPDLLHPERNVLSAFFINWMLAHCATTDDVRRALNDQAVRVIGGKWMAKVGPTHFPVHDADGKSIVIEFLDGKPVITDNNDVGVLTNRPTFPWHLENLRNYVGLSFVDTDSTRFDALLVENAGHGTGLAGLPGNSTPPSRFVRMAYLKKFALQAASADDAQALAFHLLNTVDIPRGTVASKKPKSDEAPTAVPLTPRSEAYVQPQEDYDYDFTQWVVVKDLTHRVLNIRTSTSTLAWSVDLKDLDFKGLNGKNLPIPTGPVALPLPR